MLAIYSISVVCSYSVKSTTLHGSGKPHSLFCPLFRLEKTSGTGKALRDKIREQNDLRHTEAKNPKGAIPVGELSGRIYKFLFMGKLRLWGPERVCCARCFVPSLLEHRRDTLVVDVPEIVQEDTGVRFESALRLYESEFCLVTRGNSYSTSLIYNAILAGCIPIVVSDWFYFAYPQVSLLFVSCSPPLFSLDVN